jgi:hypothetical protein
MQGFEVKRRGELKLIKVFQVRDTEQQEVASKPQSCGDSQSWDCDLAKQL